MRKLLVVLLLALTCPAQAPIGSWSQNLAGRQNGRNLRVAPDLNGDGRPEVVSGSPLATGTAGPQAGIVVVLDGASGSVLLQLEGQGAGDHFGDALALGDVNGDGRLDLGIGAPLASGTSGTNCGRVTVHDLLSGLPLYSQDGAGSGDRFGSALEFVGDITGDGRHEILIGAPFVDGSAGTNCGEITLYAATGSLMMQREGPVAHGRFGWAVARVGDLDQDFLPEFAASAPFASGIAGANAGFVGVVRQNASLLSSFEGTSAGERLGYALRAGGDQNGDGFLDLVLGADSDTTPAGMFAGRVEVRRADNFALVWSVDGEEAGARFGASLSIVGDITGDARSEIAVGSPNDDGPAGIDAGAGTLLDGATGTTLFVVNGAQALGQLGFSCAAGRDFDLDGRGDILFASPFATSGGQAQAGLIGAYRLVPPNGLIVNGYSVGALPEAIAAIDVEADLDQDLVVVCSGDRTLRILWNGDHVIGSPTFGRAGFATLAQTVVNLPVGFTPTALAVGNLDGDTISEFVIGSSDGRVVIIDGAGTMAAPMFAIHGGPLIVDTGTPPSAISDVVIQTQGGPAVVALAFRGTPFNPGEVRRILDPMGAAILSPALATGMAFEDLHEADITGDGLPDIIATASVAGTTSIHVLQAPTFGAAPGTPYNLGLFVPVASAGASLEGDGQMNDLLVSTLGIGGGGVRILHDYLAGSGFAGALSTGPSQVRVALGWRPSDESRGIVTVDGIGNLRYQSAWNGVSFSASTALPIGPDIVDGVAAQLTLIDGGSACNGEELAFVSRSNHAVRVVRQANRAREIPVAGTGCPPGSPSALISITGTPVLGDATFGIALTGASPNVPLNFVLQIAPVPGAVPFVFSAGFCSFAWYGGTIDFIPWGMSSPSGTALLPVPLPSLTEITCIDFLVQWLIFDGGPGGFTISNSLVIRLGEYQ